MELNLLTFMILAFAAFRVTRFLVFDSLFSHTRQRILVWLANRKLSVLNHKALELITCTWCVGFWITLGVYSLFLWEQPWDFTRLEWITTFGIAGVQGLLHAYEPNDE